MKTALVGRLSAAPKRAAGKVMDEWTFYAPDTQQRDTQEIKVEVVLMRGETGLEFHARSPGYEGVIVHSDIEQLRGLVEERMSMTVGMAEGIVWEDWLKVIVSSYDGERGGLYGTRAQLTVEVKEIKRGFNAATGKAFLMSDNIRKVSRGEIKGAFERIEPDDISLDGYESHAAIKAPMAA